MKKEYQYPNLFLKSLNSAFCLRSFYKILVGCGLVLSLDLYRRVECKNFGELGAKVMLVFGDLEDYKRNGFDLMVLYLSCFGLNIWFLGDSNKISFF